MPTACFLIQQQSVVYHATNLFPFARMTPPGVRDFGSIQSRPILRPALVDLQRQTSITSDCIVSSQKYPCCVICFTVGCGEIDRFHKLRFSPSGRPSASLKVLNSCFISSCDVWGTIATSPVVRR